MQNELSERKAKWVTMLQEYDMEIQLMKLVRGQAVTHTIAKTVVETGPKVTV